MDMIRKYRLASKAFIAELGKGFVAPASEHPEEVQKMAKDVSVYNAVASTGGLVVGFVGGVVAGTGAIKALGIGCLVALAGSALAIGYVTTKGCLEIGRKIDTVVE